MYSQLTHPLCVEQVVAAWCHDDLGLLLHCEVGPGEVRVNVVLVQLEDLQTAGQTAEHSWKVKHTVAMDLVIWGCSPTVLGMHA